MTDGHEGVPIRKLPTGVPGLDDVLGGGLPGLSFNLVVGGPGSGKTPLAHQIMVANAAGQPRGPYFPIPSEPPLKMPRHQQPSRFFHPAQANGLVRLMSL